MAVWWGRRRVGVGDGEVEGESGVAFFRGS